LVFAFFAGNPAKALIFKALRRAHPSFQQSYPQNYWIALQSFLNQQLKASFARTLQENTSTQVLA
jgi:hypothetical protein